MRAFLFVVLLVVLMSLGLAGVAEAGRKSTPTPTPQSGWTTVALPDGALD